MLLAHACFLTVVLQHASAEVPKLRWFQSEDQLFISVHAPKLNFSSVTVSTPSPEHVLFNARASNDEGRAYAFNLVLREDIVTRCGPGARGQAKARDAQREHHPCVRARWRWRVRWWWIVM